MTCVLCFLEPTKIVFEMSSVANVSPHTISCCAVVHCSGDTVHWKYLIDSWSQDAADRWFLPVSRSAVLSCAVVVLK